MNEKLMSLLSELHSGQGATEEILLGLNHLALPEDYLSFLAESNGGEGFVGEEYIILWKAEELCEFNIEYEVQKYAPGIFLFASNGSGEGFGFDMRTKPFNVVQIPFIGMSLDCATSVANSFTSLIERMEVSNGSLL